MQDKHNAPAVLATMREQHQSKADQQRADEQDLQMLHVYPLADGSGFVIMDKTIEEAEQEPQAAPLVEGDGLTQPFHPKPPQTLPRVLQSARRCFALLLVFLLLDSIAPILPSVFLPTVTVTLVPVVHPVRLNTTMQLGRLTDPLTISQSQSARASGHGHQDAEKASGAITLYNGLATAQYVVAGTPITASNGITVATDTAISVPADNPPNNGVATVQAHALAAGISGNIPTGAIHASLATGLYARNLTAFTGGLDERDFALVTQADIEAARAGLQQRVSRTMIAAFNGKKVTGEEVEEQPCPPITTADHQAGDEAPTVTVTVSLTCQALIYNTRDLQTQATRKLAAQVQKQYGTGYTLSGAPDVQITHIAAQAHTVTLSYLSSGICVFGISQAKEQSLKALIAGEPRLIALHLLTSLPGIREAAITGIASNATVPDADHISILVIILPQEAA